MNTGLLAINNMFVGTTSVGPSTLSSAATEETKPFSLTLADTPQSLTTDKNDANNAKGCPEDDQTEDFNDTLNQKADLQTHNGCNDKAKVKTKCSNVADDPTGHSPIKGSVVPMYIGIDSVSRQQKGAKNTGSPTQLINNPCSNKLTRLLSAISQRQNATDKVKQGVKTAEKAILSNGKVIIAKGLINLKSSQELMKKAVINGKQKPKTDPRFRGGKLDPVKTGSPAATDNIPKHFRAGQKNSVLNYSLHQFQGKPLGTKQSDSGGPVGPRIPKDFGSASFIKSTDCNIADHKTLLSRLDSNVAKLSDNFSGDSLSQKLSLTGLQISTGQNKGGGSSMLKPRTSVIDSRFFASTSIENPASSIEFGKFLTSTQATNTANPSVQVSLSDVSKSIGEQIVESIHASLHQLDKHITISLNPPDLGKVFVRFQEQEDQIIGLLEVSKAQTKYEIEQALPQMIRILVDSGIHIKRLVVQLTDQLQQQADKYQSLADDAFGSTLADSFERNSSGNPDNIGTGESVMDTYSHEDINDQSASRSTSGSGFVTDGSINMLV